MQASNTNLKKKKKRKEREIENGKDTWLVLEVRVSFFGEDALG